MAELVTLRDCPPGPFLHNGVLGFKTEYNAVLGTDIGGGAVAWHMSSSPDVYVMASGETFWGNVKTRAERDGLLVTSVDVILAESES